jgi:uncharacterized protein YybS (DUF2232 family)
VFWASHWAAELNNWRSVFTQIEGDEEQIRPQRYFIGMAVYRLALSVSLINFMLVAWLNLFFLNRLSKKRNLSPPMVYESLLAWSSPFHLVWVLVASLLAVWLSDGLVYWLGLNILIVLLALYWFHGLAVSAYFCDKKNVPLWLRVIFLLLMLPMIYLTGLVALLGLFDLWFNWRGTKTETVD